MKKSSTLIVAFLLAAWTSFAQVNLQFGLVAYYPMNNSPLDSSSNHLDLSIFGSPTAGTDRFGNPNGAYVLRATIPDYFTTSLNSLTAPSEVTLAAWVSLQDPSVDQKIAGRAVVGSGYLMGVDSGMIDPEFWDVSGTHFRHKVGTINPANWTHLVISYKANDYMKSYIDGVIVDSLPASANGVGTNSSWPFTVGGAPWQPTALNTTGSIDDIYLYERAINAAEVQALYSMITSTIDGQSTFGEITLYPVPGYNGNLNVEFRNNVSGHVIVKMIDFSGKEVYQADFMNPKKETLNPGILSDGLYSISFTNGKRVESHTIVIQ